MPFRTYHVADREVPISLIRNFKVFAFLQALDGASTLVGLHTGLFESGAFIRFLGGIATLDGAVILAKVLAVLAMLRLRKNPGAVGAMNLWYLAIVAWNLSLLAQRF